MPWDLDRSFANLPVFGSNNMQMNLSMTHPYAGPHRLTDRLMAMPQIADRYQNLMRELSATCFAKDRVLQEIHNIEATIKEARGRDQKAAKDRKETPGAFGPLAAFGPPPTLEKFVEKRVKSLTEQLAGKTKGHLPSGGFGPGAMMKLGDFMVGPMMDSFDTDKDDMISKEEWIAIVKRLESVCPKDANGRINEKAVGEGLNAMFPKSPEGTPPPPPGFSPTAFMAAPIIRRSGPDKDGTVSIEQMMSAAEKIFAEFDKAKTGKLEEPVFADMLTAIFPVPNFGPPKGPLPKKEGGSDQKKP
jgi:hypothetical protein